MREEERGECEKKREKRERREGEKREGEKIEGREGGRGMKELLSCAVFVDILVGVYALLLLLLLGL